MSKEKEKKNGKSVSLVDSVLDFLVLINDSP